MQHLSAIFADLVFVIILQITGLTADQNLKLQLAGLAGSMLAVRTIDGQIKLLDWLKVAFSGMIVANYAGGYFCEYLSISFASFAGMFWYFVFGFLSDILLRIVNVLGKTTISEAPNMAKALLKKLMIFFTK